MRQCFVYIPVEMRVIERKHFCTTNGPDQSIAYVYVYVYVVFFLSKALKKKLLLY